jgi:PAS domain S-box-containing protein
MSHADRANAGPAADDHIRAGRTGQSTSRGAAGLDGAAAFAALPDPAITVDAGHRIVAANAAFGRRLGLTPQECVGRCCHELVHGGALPMNGCPLDAVLHDGREHVVEFFEPRFGGWVVASTLPLRDFSGRLLGALQVLHVVGESIRSEGALRETDVHFRTLADSAPIGIYLTDPDGACTYANRQWNRMGGLLPGEALGDGWVRGVHQADRERVLAAWQRCVAARRGFAQEYRMVDDGGVVRWVSCRAVPLRGADGEVLGYVGTTVDITERKRSEDALRASEARFRTVADFTYDWEYWAAPDGTLSYVSPSCQRITGYAAAEFAGHPNLLLTIVHLDDREAFREHARQEQESSGQPHGIVFRIIARDGRMRWIGHECQHVHSADGQYLGIRGSNRDITDRKEAEDALREADRLRASLLSSVSHQLKTPLAGLEATISNLLEGDLHWDEADVRRELVAALTDITRLGNSIGALLDVARLEAHVWEPRPEWHDMEDIVDSATYALPAPERERVVASYPPEMPSVYVDYEQAVRVLQNLLENAVVYGGPAARVRVEVRAARRRLTIRVEDDGRGIPEEERELVFEKFYRTAEGAKVPSGTGLGLAIAREIVNAHGGSIRVECVQPHGTRVIIDLPQPDGESGQQEGRS